MSSTVFTQRNQYRVILEIDPLFQRDPSDLSQVYVAGADEDAGFPPEQADRLREALTAAGVDNEVTIYAGARHGYAPPDMPVYNEDAAERHWREMLKLFAETLK